MARSDLNEPIEAARIWLQIVMQMQSKVEAGAWEDLPVWQKKRDEIVRSYQSHTASLDYSQYLAADLLSLQELLASIQNIENGLVDRLQEYKYQITESLDSIRMEDSLRHRYGLDGT